MEKFFDIFGFMVGRGMEGWSYTFSMINFIVSWTATLVKRFLASSYAVMHLGGGGVNFKICMTSMVDLIL